MSSQNPGKNTSMHIGPASHFENLYLRAVLTVNEDERSASRCFCSRVRAKQIADLRVSGMGAWVCRGGEKRGCVGQAGEDRFQGVRGLCGHQRGICANR
jgi:hypothetical protein